MIHPITNTHLISSAQSASLGFIHYSSFSFGFGCFHHYAVSQQQRTRKRHENVVLIMSLFDNNNDNNNRHDDDENENTPNKDTNSLEDYEFLQDFYSAKSEKFGMNIINTSSDEIQQSIQDSQNEFLNAMKLAKEEFTKSKNDVGLDCAIELLKEDWDEEDRLWELEQKEFEEFGFDNDSLEEEDDDEDNDDGNIFQ